MFESAALGRSYPAKEYAALENDLRMKLFKAQGTCIEHNLPVLSRGGRFRARRRRQYAFRVDGRQDDPKSCLLDADG
jgi:hypothetical protein